MEKLVDVLVIGRGLAGVRIPENGRNVRGGALDVLADFSESPFGILELFAELVGFGGFVATPFRGELLFRLLVDGIRVGFSVLVLKRWGSSAVSLSFSCRSKLICSEISAAKSGVSVEPWGCLSQ